MSYIEHSKDPTSTNPRGAMTKVADRLSLFPRVVDDPREIDRLRWFQTQRYVACGLLDEMPQELPYDPYVASSTYFGVYTQDNQIQATARIVADDIGLPMFRYHDLYPLAQARLNAAKGSVSEISRLAVGTGAPRHHNLTLLAREFMRFCINNPRASLLVGSVGEPLARIMNRVLRVKPEILGDTIPQYGDFVEDTSPILLDTVKCIAALRERDDARSQFFFEDLVFDLTLDNTRTPSEPAHLAIAGG